MQLPKRRGLALTIVGAVLMLIVAPVAIGIGIWQGVSRGMSAIDDQPWIAPGAQVQVTRTGEQTILVEGSYRSGEALPTCRVGGPAGRPVSVQTSDTRLSLDWGGTSVTRAATFEAPSPGGYTVRCADSLDHGSLRAKVLQSNIADDVGSRVLVPLGIGVGVGAIAFLVGVILLIVGIVKLVNSGRERSAARMAGSTGNWAPGAGGYQGGSAPYPPSQGYDAGRPQQGTPGDPDDPYAR